MPTKFKDGECPRCGSSKRIVDPRWLRERRTKARMTLREFAERAGVSAPYICDIEYGRRACLPDMLARYEALVEP